MATYNGEKFIKTQLDSIVNQSFKDWKLFIHDDGSTDNTIEIIKEFIANDSRIVLIEDGKSYKNPGLNFLSLLHYSKSDYVCFADQDDYWFEYKLSVMYEKFNKTSSFPELLLSNCYLWNSERYTVSPKINFAKAEKLEDFLFLNGGLQGCAMMFNAELRELALRNTCSFVYMHDHLISLLAYSFGNIKFIDEKLFLYRQHNNNQSVHIDVTVKDKLLASIKNTKIPVVYKKHYNAVKAFYESYERDFTNQKRSLLKSYLLLKELQPLTRFLKILFSPFSLGKKGKIKLIIKLIIRKYWCPYYE